MAKNLSAREKKAEASISQKALLNILEDITEARDELAKAKDYVDNIIKSMIDTLLVINPDITIRTVNKAACDLLGYEEQELIGRPAGAIFAQGATPFKGIKMKKLIEEGSLRDYEMVCKTKAGEKIPVSFSGSVMKDKEGELIGIVSIARDMREIKRLMQKEKDLAVAEAAAEAEKKRAQELEAAYKKLEEMQDMLIQAEKLNAVGQLASGVAHEVKNPLGVIIQGVNYLERRLPKRKNISEIVEVVKGSVERADNIIRTLIDFSRAARLELRPQDISSILKDSLVLIQHKVKMEEIKVVKEIEKGLPEVSVDKGKIEQVFINIFLNAIQAMPKGGKLFIRSYLTQLNVPGNEVGRRDKDRFKLGEKAVMVEVEDTGVGISKEEVKKIFDPFFTTKGPRDGAGLGLSVTKNIIDMHNGIIEINSEKDKGTKVIIALKIHGGG